MVKALRIEFSSLISQEQTIKWWKDSALTFLPKVNPLCFVVRHPSSVVLGLSRLRVLVSGGISSTYFIFSTVGHAGRPRLRFCRMVSMERPHPLCIFTKSLSVCCVSPILLGLQRVGSTLWPDCIWIPSLKKTYLKMSSLSEVRGGSCEQIFNCVIQIIID